MADCLVYWKYCSAELNEFTSDNPGPWNFHYNSRSRRLFDQITRSAGVTHGRVQERYRKHQERDNCNRSSVQCFIEVLALSEMPE